MTLRALRFAVLPTVTLHIRGDEAALRHYEAEYGPAATTAAEYGSDAVEVAFDRGSRDGEPMPGGSVLAGSHKTVSWHADVSDPDARPMRARIEIRGVPRWFGLSLTQGYLVEPLLSVAAAAVGVLLPAAAFVTDGGATVLLGRSRSGKSSLTMRAAAAGLPVLGDDQVLVGRSGTVTRFPRRLRVYDDLGDTAPDAFARLSGWARRALRVRRLVRTMTAGYVRPSLAIPVSAVRGAVESTGAPLARLVVLQRTANLSRIEVERIHSDAVLASGAAVMEDQRRHLARLGPAWSRRLEEVAVSERPVLADAIARVGAERVLIPDGWTAKASLDALWEHLWA